MTSNPPNHTKNLVDCALAFQDATTYFRSPAPVRAESLCGAQWVVDIAAEFSDHLPRRRAHGLCHRWRGRSQNAAVRVARFHNCRLALLCSYHLFGETVSTTQALEASGAPGCVVISDATFRALGDAGQVSYVFQALQPLARAGKRNLGARFHVICLV